MELETSRQAVRFFVTLLRASTDGIVITDASRNIVMVNEAFCGFFDRSEQDLMNTSLEQWLGLLNPDALQRWTFLEHQVHIQGMCSDIEFWMIMKDGSRRHLSVNASIMQEVPGEERGGVVSIWRDVTDRVRAEEALRQSEAQKQALLDGSPDVIRLINTNMEVLWANKTALDMNYDTIGEKCYKSFSNQDQPCQDCPGKKAISTGHIETAIQYYPFVNGLDGESYWESVGVPLKDDTGRVIGVIEIFRNATKRIYAENALKESEERFRSLVETTSDWVWEVDASGLYTYAGSRVKELLGYEPEEILGKMPFDLMPPDEANRVATIMKDASATKSPIEGLENVNIHKDGRIVILETSGVPIIDSHGNLLGFRGIDRDITKRKEAERRLEEQHVSIQTHAYELESANEELHHIQEKLVQFNRELQESEAELAAIYENAPLIMILVDEDRRVLKANQAAIEVADRRQAEVTGLRGGEALRCIHAADDPAGCGFGLDCSYCIVKNTVLDTFRTGAIHHRVEAPITIDQGDGPKNLFMLVSTAMLQVSGRNTVLVCLEDITERKEAEDALRESEGKYRMLVDNLDNPLTLYDSDGQILFINEAGASNLDATPADVIGKSLYEFFADAADIYVERARKVYQLGEGIQFEDKIRLISGEKWFWSDIQPVKDTEGKVMAVQNISYEITKRKRAEDALRESEKSLRQAQEIAHVGSWEWNLESGYFHLSEEMYNIYGYPVSHKFDDVWSMIEQTAHPDDREMMIQEIDKLKNGPSRTLIYRIIRPDGNERWIEAPPPEAKTYSEDGSPMVFVGAVQDITDRKHAEEQLMQRNRELIALNEITQTMSQYYDLDDLLNNAFDKTLNILDINHGIIVSIEREPERLAFRVVRGVESEGMKTLSSVGLNDDLIQQVADLGEPLFVESLVDSSEKPDSQKLKAVKDRPLKSAMYVPIKVKGNVAGVICTFTEGDRVFSAEERELLIIIGHEISTAMEKAHLLDEASKAEALEELNKLRTGILASVSHELRTPLTAIKGMADTLVQPDVAWDKATQDDFLRTISQESDVLARIVDDLMQMSQIEAGILKINREIIDLPTVMEHLTDHFKKLVKNHRLTIDIPSRLPEIWADKVRIGEVITNLISNAASYSEEGTEITLRIRETSDEIVISVSDQGMGIAEEEKDRIFERFYRLESGIARRRGGIGLGNL